MWGTDMQEANILLHKTRQTNLYEFKASLVHTSSSTPVSLQSETLEGFIMCICVYLCVCVCVCVCTRTRVQVSTVLIEARRGCQIPGSGVTGGYG